MSEDPVKPIYAAILGTDALLAARPADPIRLTRACQRAGFEFVAPVSWGEELIASHLAEQLGDGKQRIIATCPMVSEWLNASAPSTPAISTVPPPVACARYLRAAFHPRPVHITYVGGCPGAHSPEIDVQCLPEALLARFSEAGIDLMHQPLHFDGQLPVDRSRYASTPGGVPAIEWLEQRGSGMVVEAAPITADVVAATRAEESLLIDLSVACRCVCARHRTIAERMEPPRAAEPVVSDLGASVLLDRAEPVIAPVERTPAPVDRRARFAENGLSEGEALSIPDVAQSFSLVREPW